MPERRNDPRFNCLVGRSQNRYELADIIQDWITVHFKNRDEAVNFFRADGLIAAPVQTLTEALNDPQFNSRDNMDAVEVPGLGSMMLPKAPYHMSETPSTIPGNAALLGEHNYEILSKDLGFPEQKIRSLTEQGILSEDPTLAARCGWLIAAAR